MTPEKLSIRCTILKNCLATPLVVHSVPSGGPATAGFAGPGLLGLPYLGFHQLGWRASPQLGLACFSALSHNNNCYSNRSLLCQHISG